MKRALTVNNVLEMEFVTMDFDGEFLDLVGKDPERSGCWIIYGKSGNGKTSFCMQLAKYLTRFGTVLYNSIEEGASRTMQEVLITHHMAAAGQRFKFLDKEPIAVLKERLRKRRSPDIVFIDSLQHARLNLARFHELKDEFPHKLFIFVSHVRRGVPVGAVGEFLKYHANVKLRVEGYKAFPISRYKGKTPFVIYKQEADLYWADYDINKKEQDDE